MDHCCGSDLFQVNLLVRQINQKTDMIKQYMSDAWSKLEQLEASYNGMLLKTHRLQSNRICLDVLSGEPVDGHPHSVRTCLLYASAFNFHRYLSSAPVLPKRKRKRKKS